MDANAQALFNIIVSLCAMLGGWMLKSLQASLEHLQLADLALTQKIQSIEVLVAGNYVKRDDMERMSQAIFSKLDRIESKLDGKVDK